MGQTVFSLDLGDNQNIERLFQRETRLSIAICLHLSLFAK